MKFKPGFSCNWIGRYVQVSHRAFRYFRNQLDAIAVKPIVSFRKRIIDNAKPVEINKASYLKQGSRVFKQGKEDNFFDNAFELELNEPYEDNYLFRDVERAVNRARARRNFHKKLRIKSQVYETASRTAKFFNENSDIISSHTRNKCYKRG